MPTDVYREFYRRVPIIQIEGLKKFRAGHPIKHITIDALKWQYVQGGQEDQGLLFLPDGTGNGEAFFHYITAFESKYSTVAPFYPPAKTIEQLIDGILYILDVTGIRRFYILGQSMGGLLAQVLVRKCPTRVDKLILSHTTTTSPPVEAKLANERIRRLLGSQTGPLIPFSSNRSTVLGSFDYQLDKKGTDEKEFWRALMHENSSHASKEFRSAINQCAASFFLNYHFTLEDLKYWKGKTLILESENDVDISPTERKALKLLYPQADVCTLNDIGHTSLYLKREEVIRVIQKFMEKD